MDHKNNRYGMYVNRFHGKTAVLPIESGKAEFTLSKFQCYCKKFEFGEFDKNACDIGISRCSLLSDTMEWTSSTYSTFSQCPTCSHRFRSAGSCKNEKRASSGDIIFDENENDDTLQMTGPFRNRAVTICGVPSISNRKSNWIKVGSGRCGLGRTVSKPHWGPITSQPLSPLLNHSRFDFSTQMAQRTRIEELTQKHGLKEKLNRFSGLMDDAFTLINAGDRGKVVDGGRMVVDIMEKARISAKMGHELVWRLCDYIRRVGYLDTVLDYSIDDESDSIAKRACIGVLEVCINVPNSRHISAASDKLERLTAALTSFHDGEDQRTAIAVLEKLFEDSHRTSTRLVNSSALDYLLNACKSTTSNCTTICQRVAEALANLCLNSDQECQQRLIDKNASDWLFVLASSQHDPTRFYACLAVCALVANKEIEAAVVKSGTLALVEPFLSSRQPREFANLDRGRHKEWLANLVPMLRAKRPEPRSMAAFYFATEAGIKKKQDALDIFDQIGATEALKEVASLPEETAPKFARLALEIIGEQVPYKLSQQVALWSAEDVQRWIKKIGFDEYATAFSEHQVDGDLLLLITEDELEKDIGMTASLARRRFMRELDALKIAADYSCLDGGDMDRFLTSIDPRFSVYTYKLLELGVDCSNLSTLTDDVLKNECGIMNSLHRKKLVQLVQGCNDVESLEAATGSLGKQIDIFICYRRSTGNQLASLVKVMLQLQGYKVFIDIDRLYAGKFDCSLLKNIRAAKHFVLVLTPQALDRCFDDDECVDWVHKELSCAIQHNKNIIPILDPEFQWPEEHRLPHDIRVITRFNGVRWIHEYQEACIAKLTKFIIGEVNVNVLTPEQKAKLMLGIRSARTCAGIVSDADSLCSSPRSRSNTNGFKW